MTITSKRTLYGLILLLLAIPVTAQNPTPTAPQFVQLVVPNPNRQINILPPGQSFEGHIRFPEEDFAYWKFEIRSQLRNGTIGQGETQFRANNWTTVGEQRTEPEFTGQLAFVAPYPELEVGPWDFRIVGVKTDGSFIETPYTGEFIVRTPRVPAVPNEIVYPANGQIIYGYDNEIRGLLRMNQAAYAYQFEIIGGQYNNWTNIYGPIPNDRGNPITIDNGVLGELPPILDELEAGRYRLRLVVLGEDANWLQPPTEIQFAVRTPILYTLTRIRIRSPLIINSRTILEEPTDIIGTVEMPDHAAYFKVEIKDDIADNNPFDQQPRFTDWTTIGDIQDKSVFNGKLAYIPALIDIAPGTYRIRIVVVGKGNDHLAVSEILTLIRPPAPTDE